MRTRAWAFVAVILLGAIGGASCSSGSDEVSSGKGPQPAKQTTTTKAAEKSTTTSTTEAPAEPATSPSLVIAGTVTIPDGEKGKLSIALTGAAVGDDGSVPVVVRNRTSKTIYDVEVSGTARATDGSLAGSGSSQGFAPSAVGPGEWAFGYVFFEGSVPAGATFDLTAKGETDTGFLNGADVTIAEHNVVPGDYGTSVIGIVSNKTEKEVSGPVSVDLMCFDDAGTAPVSTARGYAESDPIPAGGTSSFSVDLPDGPCTNFAMGASGYTS
jgi:hypothetical protein